MGSGKSGAGGGKHLPGGGAPFSYIPPAAIQNAMMTKDKKPFTYTPGGIDFLAEIRSPRMQRRISKNAADEGVASHQQTTTPAPQQLSPQAMAAMQPQMAVPVFPPTPQQMPVLHSPPAVQHYEPPTPPPQPPPPPQPARINLKPAVPQFLQPQISQSPEQIFQDCINSLPAGRNNHNSPAVQQNSVPASFPERRNAQLGSIYIPPVAASSNGHAPSAGPISPVQLNKTSMPPWMNSQNRTPISSPSPSPFVQQERVVPVEEAKLPVNVRMIPIAVEGGRTLPTTPQRNNQTVPAPSAKEEVHPPWHNAQQNKVIPIHLEGAQQAAPWRTQAAANANQIASMMEELMMSPTGSDSYSSPTPSSYNRAVSVEQPRGQPTQSRSFRILQMIHDPANDPADDGGGEQGDSSGRLSRSSVGSNNSGGAVSVSRVSQAGPPPVGERRLNLTQDDRELMDMFRSQVNEEQSLHQEVDPRYRGSHIPSRAFRILQSFTADSDDGNQSVRPQASSPAPTNTSGAAVNRSRGPPSEQSEPEPRKYMGGNIPSRSFRMLQAMTALDPNEGKSDL